MKVLYLDCSAGISGDMFAGAMLGVLDDPDVLLRELKRLKLPRFKVAITAVDKCGTAATHVNVVTEPETHHRHLADIHGIIDRSDLSPSIKARAKDIFLHLGKAEADAHAVDLEAVHFHEVGAVDSIVDIVAAAILIEHVKPDHVICSPIAVGRGTVRFCHGETELPVPAVRSLLASSPMYVRNVAKELTTPTGAAIVAHLANEFNDMPNGHCVATGTGAGTRDLDFPNILVASLLDVDDTEEVLTKLETNIDDMSPELYEYVVERLMDAGAVEAYVQPCIMKKGRIGALLTVLCGDHAREDLIERIFDETSTFGIRVDQCSRVCLERHTETVTTKMGPIRIKVGTYQGKVRTRSPEYEDCRSIAEASGTPLTAVYHTAIASDLENCDAVAKGRRQL